MKKIIQWMLNPLAEEYVGWMWAGILVACFLVRNFVMIHAMRGQDGVGYTFLITLVTKSSTL